MFQLAFEGRACCMSNKNVQLVSNRFATLPTLQVNLSSTPASHCPGLCCSPQLVCSGRGVPPGLVDAAGGQAPQKPLQRRSRRLHFSVHSLRHRPVDLRPVLRSATLLTRLVQRAWFRLRSDGMHLWTLLEHHENGVDWQTGPARDTLGPAILCGISAFHSSTRSPALNISTRLTHDTARPDRDSLMRVINYEGEIINK